MSTLPSINHKVIKYPTTDGKPMAETDRHRIVMVDTIAKLQFWYAGKPRTYVSGNMLMYYVPGNKRKHVSPDVFVVQGIAKKERLYYLVWEEKKSPAMILEITSSSTRKEDSKTKFVLYREVLKVKEYFQFDPFGDYLKPQLQGYRLHQGDYVPITPVDGRLPSKVVNLHLEVDGTDLQLYDPVTQKWIPTPEERAQAETERAQAEAERAQAEAERAQAEAERAQAAEERVIQAERDKKNLAGEVQRLREEIDQLRRQHVD
jgi:Uma2 family endonuclease